MLPQPIPSLAYLKTHKTGSSTLSTVVNRVTDARQMKRMQPPNDIFLGWPEAFPGDGQPAPHHQFDVIANHGVYNHEAYASYLKPNPLVFTILREPISRSISAYNYWPDNRPATWHAHIQRLQAVDHARDDRTFLAKFGNALAYDLGWYRMVEAYGKGRTAHDHDATHIAAFVHDLNSTIDLAIMLEELDEGLVLLGRLAGLSVVELAYHPMKTTSHDGAGGGNAQEKPAKVYPSDGEREQLEQYLEIDAAIYEHFRAKFTTTWAAARAADPTIDDDLALLRCLNAQLVDGCASGNQNAQCQAAFLADSKAYTQQLHHGGFAG